MADWLNINSFLNSYQKSLTNRATGVNANPDPIRQVLLNSSVNWEEPPDTLTGRSNRGGPSVLSRVFDILSRPRYAVSEATRQGIQPGGNDFTDALGGFFQGLSGKKKTSWANVIAEQEYNMRPNQFQKPANVEDYKRLNPDYKGPDKLSNKGIIGFGLAGDILLDPINFIGPGSIKAGVNAGRKALGFAPKVNAIDEAVRPGVSVASNILPPRPDTPPVQSLIPTNQTLPPGLNPANAPVPTSGLNLDEAIRNVMPMGLSPQGTNNLSASLKRLLSRYGAGETSQENVLKILNKNNYSQSQIDDLLAAAKPNNPQPASNVIQNVVNTGIVGVQKSANDLPMFQNLSATEKYEIARKMLEEAKKVNGGGILGAQTALDVIKGGKEAPNLLYSHQLGDFIEWLKSPKYDVNKIFEDVTGIKPPAGGFQKQRNAIPVGNQLTPPVQQTSNANPVSPGFNPISSSLSNEAIISPAARSLNDFGSFPQVTIPRSATAVGKTNPEIRSLIREIADTAEVPRPKFINKMNKQELSYTLKKLRSDSGRTALSKATQTEPLPKPPPKLNVFGVENAAAKANESSEALRLAQKYEDDVLSKPNMFPTPGRNPAVNNPAQQVNFFNNKILPAARALYPKRNKPGINAVALRMLKEAENAFEAKGLHPAFWSGVPFKLSEVIDRMGGLKNMGDEHLTRIMTALGNEDVSKIKSPQLKRVLDAMISEQKLKEVPYVDRALTKSIEDAAVAENVMSQPKFEKFKDQIIKTQKADLKQPKQMVNLSPNVPLYITPKSADFANQTLKQIFKASTPLPQNAINSNIKAVQQYIRSDGSTYWAPINNAISKAINQTIGGPSPRELGTQIGDAANVENWLLSRFSTAYGNKDLRPDVLIAQQTGRARATRRAKVLNAIAKNYTAAEIEDAFKVAQGAMPGATTKIDELAHDFEKTLENLFDASDLSKATGNSVAFRTGMVMSEINKQLKYMKAGFKFTNGNKVEDGLGNIHDFSQGADWLKSWKIAQVDDPLVFMSKIQSAVENVVAKNSYLDDFASRWGSKFYDPKNGFTAKISDPRLKNLYYNPELASQMKTVLKNWDQIYDPKSPLVKLFDQATSLWKTGMTIYMPAHHIRNMIGDVYMGWMDGVNTVKPYRIASKVMWSQRNRYDDIQGIENLVNRNSVSAALTRPGDNVLRTKSGLDVTAEQLYTAAFNTGLLQSANVVEDIITDVIPKVKPFGGKVSKVARGFAEGRDHFTRLAHFIDIVQKSKSKNLEQVFEEASKRVRKWHPDGMDLTDFERKYMRRVMPFYSWTRKSIPLVIESAVMRPGKTMVYPKFMYGLQQLSGVESASISDPFPEDQLFPDWIKEKGIGPIAAHGMGGIPGAIAGLSRSRPGFTGEREGYTVANPSNPFVDTVAQFAGMGRFKDFRSGVGQMVNPFFRVPAEVGTGQTVLGTPVDYDPNKYATENIPLVAYLSQLGNIGIAGPTERGQQEGVPNTEGIVNFLTALGLRGTGASIKQAEFEARERAKKQNGG